MLAIPIIHDYLEHSGQSHAASRRPTHPEAKLKQEQAGSRPSLKDKDDEGNNRRYRNQRSLYSSHLLAFTNS